MLCESQPLIYICETFASYKYKKKSVHSCVPFKTFVSQVEGVLICWPDKTVHPVPFFHGSTVSLAEHVASPSLFTALHL